MSETQGYEPTPEAEVTLVAGQSEVVTLGELFTLQRAKKAWSAGLAAGILAAGSSVGLAFSDGKVESGELAVVAGAFIVPFVGAFFAAWLPKNK